ncbi:MAG: T9SS type A sorting domain-containing protein [Bacteroidota bacterium]
MKHLYLRMLFLVCFGLSISYAQTDVGVTSITSLNLTCSLFGSGDTMTIRYNNFGTTTVSNVPLGYSLTGLTPVAESNPASIAPGANTTYTFNTPLAAPQPNTFYVLKIWTALPGDVNAANDTFSTTILTPDLASLPFSEDFESFVPQSNPNNAGGVSNGWSRSSTTPQGWYVGQGSTNTPNTGPTDDQTPGGSNYMFTEATGGTTGSLYRLTSPCIDLGGTVGPRLSFWYHMFGDQMGTLEVLAIEGNTETVVWTLTGEQQTNSADPFLEAIVDLSPFAGSVIQLQFRGTRGTGARSDMAIDDIFLFDPGPIDPGVVEVISPNGPGCYGGSEDVEVIVENFGSQVLDFAATPVWVISSVTGPISSIDSVLLDTGTLNIFDTRTVLVSTTADLSATGTYIVKGYTAIASDPNAFNDTTTVNANTLNAIPGPYSEDFEGGTSGFPGVLPPGWNRTPTNSPTWHINFGNTPTTQTGPSGNNTPTGFLFAYAEMDNGTQGDQYQLISPCLDLSNMAAPKLEFFYHMFGINTGTLDVLVRTSASETNVFSLTGQQQTGSNIPYESVVLDLTSFKQDVLQLVFRVTRGNGTRGDIAIDDINIFEPPAVDVAVGDQIVPESGCGLGSAEQVTIQIINLGTDTLNSVTATFSVDAGPFITPEAVPGFIAPGDTLLYTYTATADLSALGPHTLEVSATQNTPPDADVTNNSQVVNIINLGQVVNSFPYFEDFEGGQAGWTSQGVNNTWAFGTPAKNVIQGASSGVNAWVTGGLGLTTYTNFEQSFVLGPCFDFSGVTAPIIELDIWWDAEDSFDGAVLQSSVDGGVTWQRVGNFGDPDNWYNDNFISAQPGGQPQGWTGDGTLGSQEWVNARHELDGLGGESAVLLRVAFGADVSITEDGFAFDNVSIFDKPDFDAAAVELLNPSGACGYSAATPITVSYVNEGVQTIDSIQIFYQIDGGTPVGETDFQQVQPDSIGIYTFTTTADLSNLATSYDITFYVVLLGDTLNVGDTLTTPVTPLNFPEVNTFPYAENFENGQGGWTSGGTLNTWAFGTPGKTIINSAFSGVNSWVTGGLGNLSYANGEASFVIGPCMNMSAITNPVIRMGIWYDSEFSFDGAVLQASTDGGETWTRVGEFNDPVNWYNDNFISAQPGNQPQGWTGGSNGWLLAQHALDNLGGEPTVRLRIAFDADFSSTADGFAFDDVFIWERATDDASAVAFNDLPLSICDDDSVELVVTISNDGLVPQQNIPVTLVITDPNNSTTTLNTTFTGFLPPGTTGTVNFGFFSSPLGGAYDLQVYTDLANDTTVFNDTTLGSFQIDAILTPPSAIGDTACNTTGDIFFLSASPQGTGDIYWYDSPTSSTIVGQGNTFTTPFLSTSTTYYAEEANLQFFTAGKPDNTGGFGFHDTNFGTNGLTFNVEQDLVLESVLIYPENNSNGTVTINLRNALGQVLETTNFTVNSPAPLNVEVPLNWSIPAGTGYRIDASGTSLGFGQGLFRNSSAASFPYEVPGLISITGNVNGLTTSYYFFYNWRIRTAGCPSPRVPVQAIILPPAFVNLGIDGVFCGERTVDVGSPALSTYQWSLNGVPFATTPSVTIDSTGQYTILVTNSFGCTAEDTANFTFNDAPVADAGPDSASCDPILLEAEPVAGATYFWFSPVPQNQDSSQQSYLATNTSVYILTVTALGCTNTDTVNIEIFPTPDIDLGGDITSCSDVILDAGTSGMNYQWSSGDTSSTIIVTPPLIGVDTFSVVVTNGLGCVGRDTATVAQGAAPIVDLGTDTTSCNPITLDAGNPGLSYDWSTGETSQTIVASQSDTYMVTVTNADGCQTVDMVDVTIAGPPDVVPGYLNTNNDLTVNFFIQSGADPSNDYTWIFNDGTGATSNDPSPTYTFGFAGTYNITLITTNACGSDTTTLLITNVANDDALARFIQVAPNPTEGRFHVKSEMINVPNLFIEVVDVQGRIVYQYQQGNVSGSFDHAIDISDQALGIYVLRISDGVREVTQRIIRQ